MRNPGNVLVVRLDNAGDVLLAGPAIRAVAGGARRVTLLAGPRGRAAAALLPGVDEIVEWCCPWIDPEPGPVRHDEILATAAAIGRLRADQAVILTSFHQDPLPTALLLRMAGVPHVTAACDDYPGSLLDVRHRLPGHGLHEVERMLSVAEAAGFAPPADRRLALRALAAELRGQVRVTLLVPGGMQTAFFDDREDRYKPPPDARLNSPAHVARAVLFALTQPPGCELRELVVTSSQEESWP